MGRPVTLFTGQWADLPLDTMLQKAKSFGYDGVELACWGDHFEVPKADQTYREVERAKLKASRAVKHFGVSVVNSFTDSNVWHDLHAFPPHFHEMDQDPWNQGGASGKPPRRSTGGSGGGGDGGGGDPSPNGDPGWFQGMLNTIARARHLLRALKPLMEELGGFCHSCHKFFLEIVLLLVFALGLWQVWKVHQPAPIPLPPPGAMIPGPSLSH